MKNLLTVFAVLFLLSFSSAQTSDVGYTQGYNVGYASIVGTAPNYSIGDSGWQSVDYSNFNSAFISSERKLFTYVNTHNYYNGYKAGVLSGKQEVLDAQRRMQKKLDKLVESLNTL